jgi:hypothetical protein
MRSLACVVAIAAAIDPQVRFGRPVPVAVSLRDSSGVLAPDPAASTASAETAALRARLEAAMPGAVAINTIAEPRALIASGPRLDASALPASGPVSFVLVAKKPEPHVRVVSVTSPRPVLPGWSAVVAAEIEGRGLMPGSTSAVVLESHGVEVDRVEHGWSRRDERFIAHLAFAPPAAGSFGLVVRALEPTSHAVSEAESIPASVVAESRQLKVLAFDPRPSWASAFVRRVLEDDPDFEVVARVRASRGLEVRAGAAPSTLSEGTLNPFDLVIVGAPEELSSGEIAALESFARRRGGTVVLLADRKPRGPYVRLLGGESFDEVLLDKPIRITAIDATGLRASEFAYPRAVPAGGEALMTLPQGRGTRAPLVSIPLGAGRAIFSGLLDAWRYRGDNEDAFASFWRSQLGREAARAPRRLEVTLSPGAATPGSLVRLRAAVRATDHLASRDVVSIPAISARTIDEQGRQQFVRLWPTTETGVFEGSFVAPGVGRYDVRVDTDAGTSADIPFVVSAGDPLTESDGGVALSGPIARATGGVVVTSENVEPLVEQLRALGRDMVPTTRHPMRSLWCAMAFVGLLAAEWSIRRRHGLR